MTRVCILSSVHPALDNRIFYREARSLQRAGYQVPLIAVHPHNEVKDGIGIIAPPDDPETIAVALTKLYRDWLEGQLRVRPNPAILARYDRRNQAAQLAQIFDTLLQPAAKTRGAGT